MRMPSFFVIDYLHLFSLKKRLIQLAAIAAMNTAKHLPEESILIAPSLLAADFSALGEEVQAIEAGGAQLLHLDIMDGHFVPNISFGADIVKALRHQSALYFDVHLMISQPLRYLERFVAAGADHITFHVEATQEHTGEVLDEIHRLGCTAGLSLRPGTHWDTLLPWLPKCDMLLVMTVEPGFGGQSFREDQLPKIQALRQAIDDSGAPLRLEVDGGIAPATAPLVLQAGADVLVAGSSVFRAPGGRHGDGYAKTIRALLP